MRTIDLNSDVGELSPHEPQILPLLTSVNIACGGHAGDESSMAAAIQQALKFGVRIAAHPSYPDRADFGRSTSQLSRADLLHTISNQTGDLIAIAGDLGAKVEYIKAHGALYNDASISQEIASAIFEVAKDRGLRVMTIADSPMAIMEPELVIREGFIDRRYVSKTALMPRNQPGALLSKPSEAAEQALSLAPHVDSLCVHSDTPNAVEILRTARAALIDAGYEIRAT